MFWLQVTRGNDFTNQRSLCAEAGEIWRGMTHAERSPFVHESEATKQAWSAYMAIRKPKSQKRRSSVTPPPCESYGQSTATQAPSSEKVPQPTPPGPHAALPQVQGAPCTSAIHQYPQGGAESRGRSSCPTLLSPYGLHVLQGMVTRWSLNSFIHPVLSGWPLAESLQPVAPVSTIREPTPIPNPFEITSRRSQPEAVAHVPMPWTLDVLSLSAGELASLLGTGHAASVGIPKAVNFDASGKEDVSRVWDDLAAIDSPADFERFGTFPSFSALL